MDSSRREFLATSTTLFSGAWLAANLPMIEAVAARARVAFANQERFETLSPAEVRTMSAFAEQIIPSDQLPGAREAGAVYFVDRAIGGPMKDMQPPLRDLLKQLDEKAGVMKAGASFGDLESEQQIEIMKALEDTQPFFIGRILTVMGTFSHPKWGGGRADAGLRILGIDHQPVYQPPFGYYDAEELRQMKARQ